MCGITLRFKLSIGIDIALAALATAAPAMAGVDPNGYTATKQSMIGSCGNQWATATITRSWTHVKGGSRHDVWRVSYSGGFQTKNGAFITFPSPAACQQAPLDWPVGVSLSVGSTAGSTAPT
jgi:hypothetical protein